MRNVPSRANLAGRFLLFDQFRDRLARLRALLDPGLDLVSVELEPTTGCTGIIGSDLLDVAAVAREAPIAHHDAVKRPLFGSMPAHANRYTHVCLSFSFRN